MAAARRGVRAHHVTAVATGLVVVFLVAMALNLTRSSDPVGQIPPRMLHAYKSAAHRAPAVAPECEGLTWQMVAAIGRVESKHARGSRIAANGDTAPHILGPKLDGSGAGGNTGAFSDTDGGKYDGDTEYDRAVGPMQFIPTSWEHYGQDGNGDGVKDPNNVDDATLAAAAHLCGTKPRDLSQRPVLRKAILRYNQSESYAEDVLHWYDEYVGASADDTGPAGD